MPLLVTTEVTDATPTESHSSCSPATASIENISSYSRLPDNTHLAGSQIISLEKLYDAIATISRHSISCLSPVELIGEVQRNGLCSTLLAKCSKCNEEIMFKTCSKVKLKELDGTIRSTYQLLCTIGIPSMTKPTFIKMERLLGSAFETYLGELMLQAGREEKTTKQQIPPNNTSNHCNS